MTFSCDVSASPCSLKCEGESSCQALSVEENIWAIECEEYSCQDLTARCSKGQSCSVICNGLSACQGAVFHGKWQIACDGTSACQDVTIMEMDQPITCKGVSSCQGLSATCTEEQSCSAVCRGVSACQRAIFDGKWNLECKGVSSCQNLVLQESAGSIKCRGVDTCQGLSATCKGQSCSAVCRGMSFCERARFKGKWNLDCRGLMSCDGQLLGQTEEEEDWDWENLFLNLKIIFGDNV